MLVLTRKLQEQIRIGDHITISILKVKGNSVRVGISAPRNVRVVRGELSFHAEPGEAAAEGNAESGDVVASDSVDEDGTSELVATAMQRFIDARCRRDARLARRCVALKSALRSTLGAGSA